MVAGNQPGDRRQAVDSKKRHSYARTAETSVADLKKQVAHRSNRPIFKVAIEKPDGNKLNTPEKLQESVVHVKHLRPEQFSFETPELSYPDISCPLFTLDTNVVLDLLNRPEERPRHAVALAGCRRAKSICFAITTTVIEECNQQLAESSEQQNALNSACKAYGIHQIQTTPATRRDIFDLNRFTDLFGKSPGWKAKNNRDFQIFGESAIVAAKYPSYQGLVTSNMRFAWHLGKIEDCNDIFPDFGFERLPALLTLGDLVNFRQGKKTVHACWQCGGTDHLPKCCSSKIGSILEKAPLCRDCSGRGHSHENCPTRVHCAGCGHGGHEHTICPILSEARETNREILALVGRVKELETRDAKRQVEMETLNAKISALAEQFAAQTPVPKESAVVLPSDLEKLKLGDGLKIQFGSIPPNDIDAAPSVSADMGPEGPKRGDEQQMALRGYPPTQTINSTFQGQHQMFSSPIPYHLQPLSHWQSPMYQMPPPFLPQGWPYPPYP